MSEQMNTQIHAIREEIARLETYDKQGESYANAEGRHGWRNPIRADTGPLLESLVLAAGSKRLLEIGTAHGLSALYLVLGMGKGAVLNTVEFHEETARDSAERMGRLGVPVTVIHGEAGEVIRERLTGQYDLVFLDAQKSHYHGQLTELMARGLVGPGTVVLADNVIDREAECREFLDWWVTRGAQHRIVPTECGLLVGRLTEAEFQGSDEWGR